MNFDNEYWNKIKKLNIILAVMVVFIHAINLPMYGIENGDVFWIQNYIVNGIGKVAVPMFFMLSGLNTYHSFNRDKTISEIIRGGGIQKKVRSRIRTLVIPYIIWVTITWIGTVLPMIIPGIRQYLNGTSNIMPSIKSYVITLLTGNDTQLWFLNRLIFLIFLMPVIYIVMRNKRLGLFVWVVLAIVNCIFSRNDTDLVRVLLDYMSGVLIAIYNPKWFDKILKYKEEERHIFLFIFIFFSIIETIIIVYNKVRYLEIWVLYIMMVCIWRTLCSSRWKIKDRSFWIYLSHGIVFVYLKKVIYIIMPKTNIVALISFFALTVIVISLLCIMAKILEKVAPNIYTILVGGRIKR